MERKVDVCIYTEGTYPFRVGGVSSVIHGMMESLPRLRFGVVHIHWGDLPTHPLYPRLPNHLWTRTVPVSGFIPATAELRRIDWPRAGVHHSHTCGLAGLAAAVARQQQENSRMILSEHSLYAQDVIHALDEVGSSGEDTFAANEMPPMRGGGLGSLRDVVLSNSRMVYQSADMVTHVSERLRKTAMLFGLDAAKSVIVRNSINARPFRSRHVARRRISPPWRILLLGRIVPVKGVKVAIACAKDLFSTGFQFKMSITGPRDEAPCYATACEGLIQDSGLSDVVEFMSPRPAALALREADVLFLPSLSEAMPMVVLEAMAAGVPVVASDVGNVMEMLGIGSREPAGVVVPHAMFPQAIRDLFRSRRTRQSMGRNGPRRVARLYDSRTLARRWAGFYSGSGTSPEILTNTASAGVLLPPMTN